MLKHLDFIKTFSVERKTKIIPTVGGLIYLSIPFLTCLLIIWISSNKKTENLFNVLMYELNNDD